MPTSWPPRGPPRRPSRRPRRARSRRRPTRTREPRPGRARRRRARRDRRRLRVRGAHRGDRDRGCPPPTRRPARPRPRNPGDVSDDGEELPRHRDEHRPDADRVRWRCSCSSAPAWSSRPGAVARTLPRRDHPPPGGRCSPRRRSRDGRGPAGGCPGGGGQQLSLLGYWHVGASGASWTYAGTGPAGFRVDDGAVEGWRFVVAAPNPSSPPPRTAAGSAFDDDLRVHPQAGGQGPRGARRRLRHREGRAPARVAARRGARAPASWSTTGSTGPRGARRRGLRVRRDGSGLVCGLSGYPATECGVVVKQAADPSPDPDPEAHPHQASTHHVRDARPLTSAGAPLGAPRAPVARSRVGPCTLRTSDCRPRPRLVSPSPPAAATVPADDSADPVWRSAQRPPLRRPSSGTPRRAVARSRPRRRPSVRPPPARAVGARRGSPHDAARGPAARCTPAPGGCGRSGSRPPPAGPPTCSCSA